MGMSRLHFALSVACSLAYSLLLGIALSWFIAGIMLLGFTALFLGHLWVLRREKRS